MYFLLFIDEPLFCLYLSEQDFIENNLKLIKSLLREYYNLFIFYWHEWRSKYF